MPAALPHEGEHAARKARDALGLSSSAAVADIVAAIESLGIPVFLAPLPGDVAGLAHRVDGRWYVVGDTQKTPAGRLRFTLAHELGHVWMGHSPSVDDEATLTARSGEKQEVEANYFAAEMLVPRGAVFESFSPGGSEDCLDVAFDLASRTGTTPWVAMYRLFTCDLVEKRDRKAFELAVGAELKAGRHVATLADTVAIAAETSATRMPEEHIARVERLGDVVPRSAQSSP